MIKTIIIALSGKGTDIAAAQRGVELAKENNADIKIVCAVKLYSELAKAMNRINVPTQPSPYLIQGEVDFNLIKAIKKDELELFKSRVAEFQVKFARETANKCELVVEESNDPAKFILSQIENPSETIVVLNANRKKGLGLHHLGTVAKYVSEHAPCQVILTK